MMQNIDSEKDAETHLLDKSSKCAINGNDANVSQVYFVADLESQTLNLE